MTETALAYAKVNISLDIVSKMADGYHNMKMVMQTVSLADEISISCERGDGIKIEAGRHFLPADERNIAVKAALAFYRFTGISGFKTEIRTKKNIPVCAGLGGGSADGAAVLRVLDRLFDTGLSRMELEAIGYEFGSDVPFCIDGGTSLAEGRGEILTNLTPMPECYITICKPSFSCSTPVLFKQIRCEKIRARPDTDGIVAALEQGDLTAVARRMYNVFEDVLPRGAGDIADIKSTMLDKGALGAVMTGSGPSVIGIFDNKQFAKDALELLRQSYRECYLVETVERLGYR